MTKKQFEELLRIMERINESLAALRVPNTVYVPSPYPYVPPVLPIPFLPYITTCGKGTADGVKGDFQVLNNAT
jgi:hypothetical protein